MRKFRSAKLLGILVSLLVLLVLRGLPSGGAVSGGVAGGSNSVARGPSDWGTQTGATSATEITKLLGKVRVIETRPSMPGYERGCGKSEACSFGPAWTDDYQGPGGHDGCDTRNNVLAMTLGDVRVRPGTHDCVVIAGTLVDPYTDHTIHFTKSDASVVQIDHVYPLSLSYDMGAWKWPMEKRIRFANDLKRNLIAVDGPANASKGDRSLAKWMPPNKGFRCQYLALFLQVAIAYDLPVTVADRDYVTSAVPRCNQRTYERPGAPGEPASSQTAPR